MYCEDVDLAWRLQTLGWQCVFAPHAVVYHALSATGGGSLASYYVSRNIWLVMARSVHVQFTRPYRSRIAAYHLGRTIRTLRHLREPAARSSLRGTVVGIARSRMQRRHQRSMSQNEESRIRSLLRCDLVDHLNADRCYTHD
jgi:GT2 family glycosyltransferase